MTIECGAQTDMGKVRTNNEDSFACDETIGLFVVADGMGGHNAGEVASKMAIELVMNHTRQLSSQLQPPHAAEVLSSGIKLANQAIYEAGQKYTQNQGMGTTIVAVQSHLKSYTIAWVGDSRIYMVRHGHIQQLSTDHSLVQEQINRGMISADQAETSEFKNVLTRALGVSETVEVDTAEIPAFEHDYIILCSDGLTRFVSDEQMRTIILNTATPAAIARALIDAANAGGGRDNITVVVLHRKKNNMWERFLRVLKDK